MNRPINIVVAALGGEGGGVLASWITRLADSQDYITQSTSVPGVAQRTGATIYYIEIFPRNDAQAAQQNAVMALFPTRGDVDIVIASEIVEAGRCIQRQFVTPGKTSLITSSHRSYAISEKIALANGVANSAELIDVAKRSAKHFICFDMLEVARANDSVISSVLFGALAGSAALPFSKQSFEETIRAGGIAVDTNLRAFDASYSKAASSRAVAVEQFEPAQIKQPDATFELPSGTSVEGKALLGRIRDSFPAPTWPVVYHGVKRLVDYQDYAYGAEYLNRLRPILELDAGAGDYKLTNETARYLALWMSFEDIVRVAQLKIRRERLQRLHEEVKAAPEQYVNIVEFLRPQVDEICSFLPPKVAGYILASPFLCKFLNLFTGGKRIKTSAIHGYLLFYLLAGLKRWRRGSYVYQKETGYITSWLAAITSAARVGHNQAIELAMCGGLIKGYGETRRRGIGNLQKILRQYEARPTLRPVDVQELRAAALADDEGTELTATLQRQAA